LKSNFSACQFENALRFAAEAHLGQPIPGSAIPYLAHVFLVAVEVINHLDDIPDEDPDLLVQTALLHDVLEDTMTTREEIRAKFGEEVEYCVFLLSKEIRSECGKKKELDEYLDDLANGPRAAQIVKLADRIVNLRQPPADWEDQHIADYAESAEKIFKHLGSADPALASRLKDRIDNYCRLYVKTG